MKELIELLGRTFPTKHIRGPETMSECVVIQTPMGERIHTIKNDGPISKDGLAKFYLFVKDSIEESKNYLLNEWKESQQIR